MAKQQRLNIPANAFFDVLIARGILPAGTTRTSNWTGNVNGVSYVKFIIENDAFGDLAPGDPIPDSTVDVVNAIGNLGL